VKIAQMHLMRSSEPKRPRIDNKFFSGILKGIPTHLAGCINYSDRTIQNPRLIARIAMAINALADAQMRKRERPR
jgi:hypothetical protein